MSTAAVAVQKRSLTRGYSEIPNSLIENQSAFTHAELALALIVLRRGGAGDSTVTVSDRNWQGWTGLSPRQKEYAIAGLKQKCLNVAGRGETARYSFRPDTWENFVRTTDRSKPRTAGRKPVSPKPGAKIHPDCRERGCALLAQEAAAGGAPVAQPVARLASSKTVNLLPASRIAQPVAQMTDAAEQVWTKTLAAIRSVFPLVGVAFLLRLLGVVRSKFAEVNDSQLADAVAVAYREKQRFQKSEGLFLLTVPEALAAIMNQPRPAPGPDIAVGVERLLMRCVESLRARGAPFGRQAAAVAALAGRLTTGGGDLFEVEREMEWLEAEIIDVAVGQLSPAERDTVAACVENAIAPYRDGSAARRVLPMSKLEIETLAERIKGREVLTVLAIPRLSMFYV
jgi:hypothetical protein